MTDSIEIVLDTRGLVCPLPLLKAKQALKKLSAEESLRIWVDDKASIDDLRLLLSTADVQVQESTTATGYYFLIQKKAKTC
jgi:tRNA 2-thiouridine synthesizing protein A